MKKLLNLNNFFLLIIFCAPLYLVKVTVFSVPSNVLELLTLLAIALTIAQKKQVLVTKLLALPRMFTLSSAMIIIGLLLSIFLNDNSLVGFGLLKSWFIIPMLFSFTLYTTLESTSDLEKVFNSIYLSTAVVGLISLIYKFFGIITYDNRLSSFYISPNHLAMYLAPGVFFGLYFLLKTSPRNIFTKKTFLHLFLLTLILIPLYFTYSYGAWIALLASLLIVLLKTASIRKYLLSGALFLFFCFFALALSQTGSQKFTALLNLSPRSSLTSRITIWKVSLRLINDNALLGIGPGNFQSSYLALQKYYPPYLEWAVPQPHNLFLAFWLQAGLLGFIGFLLLLFFIFHTLWKILKDKKNTALAAPLFGFFLYTLFQGMADTPYWKNDLSFLFWLCVFLLLFLYNLSQKDFHN